MSMIFKIGKTYTCANGHQVKIMNSYNTDGFVGRQVDGDDAISSMNLVYDNDGRPRGTGFAEWTIIKEFEPGPREIIDPEYDVARLGPKKVHENVTDRLDGIVKRLIEIEATMGPLAPYRVRSVDQDLAAIHARLAKMDETHALDVTATDARLDRLSGIINVQDQRTDALEDRCTNLGHKADGAHTRIGAVSNALAGTDHEGENVKRRLDALEKHRAAAKTIIEAMDESLLAQAQRLEKLETLPGLATLNAAVVDINDQIGNLIQRIAAVDHIQAEGRRELADRLDRFALEIATKANAEGVKGELADRATVSVDLRQVHSRLNRIAGKLGMLPTAEECAAAGPIRIETPEEIERQAFAFIHKMSSMWSRTNPGAVVADMRQAGFIITQGPPR